MNGALLQILNGLNNLDALAAQLINATEIHSSAETDFFSLFSSALYPLQELPALPEVPVIGASIVNQYYALLSQAELEKLSAGEAELLSWYPPVALSLPFLDLLAKRAVTLRTRTLMGLLHSYHQIWDISKDIATIGTLIGDLLRLKPAKTRYVSIWKQRSEYIASPEGYHLLGDLLWQTRQPVAEMCRLLGIYPVSPYVRQSVLSSVKSCETRLDKLNSVDIAYLIQQLLGAPSLDEKTVHLAIDFLLCCSHIETNRNLTDSLVSFMLAVPNLGNPHIMSERWSDIRNEARTRFARLLAIRDIEFFIENLVEDTEERNHRGELWLSYVGCIQRTRLLIGEQIWERTVTNSSVDDSSGRGFGKLDGATSSALVIDLGGIVVVDFSPSYDTCYIYSRRAFSRILPEFWKSDSNVYALKDETQVLRKISRTLKSWRETTRKVLAEYGIRKAR